MHKKIPSGLIATALVAVLALGQGWAWAEKAAQPVTGSAVTAEATGPEGEWHNFGNTGSEQHYSPLADINGDTVEQLSLAWFYDLPSENTMTAPVMAEGKLFITTGHSHIRALDAATGDLLWEFDSDTRRRSGDLLRFGYGAKGLAYWQGRVYIVTHDGIVMALDAADGKVLWQQRTLEPGGTRYVNGPPRVFDGRVVIGHGGADTGPNRGYVDAFDANTGDRLWRFYTVPGNPADGFENEAMAMAAETWSGEWWKWGGGGTAWNAFSYDPELNHIYIGTGNGYPYNHVMRSAGEGDNLFLASIVAVDADSGEYVWHYQTTPGEHTDYNAVMDMTLATITVDGEPRKVIMQAPKNGFFYVLDRTSGELLSAEPFARVNWASHIDMDTGRPVEAPGYRYHGKELFELWPGVSGAHSWQPQSYSPGTGLVYIPVIERASLVGDKGLDLDSDEAIAMLGMIAVHNLDVPGARRSFLKGWDPVAQKARWEVETPGDWPGGTLATAGDLVFQGRIDGLFVAYHAETGEVAWQFDTGVPVVAPPISYRVGERQYIAVLTGSGTSGGGIFAQESSRYRTDYRMPRRVLVFALDGGEPPPPVPALQRTALADPDYVAAPEAAQEGELQYLMAGCLVCHGTDAIAGGSAPDLRYSPFILSPESFQAVVREGILVDRGMPRFAGVTVDQAEAIRHYLRSLAAAEREKHRDASD